MGYISFYSTLSQSATDLDYQALFGKSATRDGDLTSLSGQAQQIVKWIRYRLGQPIMTVELTNDQIFACFEQANIQFSSIVNTHQVQNWFLTLLGRKATGNNTGNLPNWNMNFLRQIANRYAGQSHPIVGGKQNVKRAYIDVPNGRGVYNILSERIDGQTGLGLTARVPSLSGVTAQHYKHIKVTEVYYYMSSTVNKYWDVYSISNNFFPSHRLMENWRYRLRPVFQTVLNAQMLQQHNIVRHSNYNFNIIGDLLKVSPIPTDDIRLWFDYVIYSGVLGDDRVDIYTAGKDHDTTSIWDAPYYNIPYSGMNSIGKRWVRQYALALRKQTLGLVRRKFSTIAIPNESVTLDGGSLVSQGLAKQQSLRDELRVSLDKLTLQEATRKDARMSENVNVMLKQIPMGIYIG